jgi:uncharacterized membrane protein YdjX (TVP38/TMEM64 family)
VSKSRRTVLIVAVVAVLLVAGHQLRGHLGLELSPEGVEAWVNDLGWYGPIIFVALLTFRSFVVLPSAIILSAGGLVFGVVLGTLLGSIGLMLSGLFQFGVARGVFRARGVRGDTATADRGRLIHAGAIGVGVVTAHPLGPMTPVHFGAGISTMSAATFVSAVALAAPVRSFGFSYFGTSLAEFGSAQFYIATGLLTSMIVLPLLHPRTRNRIFAPGLRGRSAQTTRGGK